MAIIINIIFLIISIILTKKGMDKEYTLGQYTQDLYLSPGEINYFMTSTNYIERGILGTLLDLYRRGNIKISPYQRESRNKKIADKVDEFEFILKSRENLTDIEREFLETTFQGENKITTDQIKQRQKNQGKRFFDSWGLWILKIEKSLAEKGLYSAERTDQEKIYHKIGLAMMLVSAILLLVSENSLYIIGLFASFPVILVHMGKSMRKTPMANGLYNDYKEIEEKLEKGQIQTADSLEMIQLIALSQPMENYQEIYIGKSPEIKIFTDYKNDQGGSLLDDAIQRSYLGYRKATRGDRLDTNKEILNK